MEDNVKQFSLSEEFLMESAEKRYESGDYLGALSMLNRRAEMYEPTADASALYADIYEALGLYPMCADAWFRFLDTCNEADFAEGYEGLSVAFMNMGDAFQSELYFRRTYEADGYEPAPEEEVRPPLRLVYSADGGVEDPELLFRGIEHIKCGELEKAREALSEVPPESKDFPSASGLTAMCLLLEGDADGAARECEKLLAYYPDNVHALTTYCAVLGARDDEAGAREVGKRLAALDVDSAEDLFRVATALCETGLDEEAYERLTRLRQQIPYGEDVLWFHAVAAYRTGRLAEAISALEDMTTVYPRKAIAEYYLVRMRKLQDGEGERFPLTYFYRMPEEEYKKIAAFLLAVNAAKQEDADMLAENAEMEDYLRIAFDQLDGRDEKMQDFAAKAAAKCRCDRFLRDILLDYNVGENIKIPVLVDLTMRNEENSFGVVVCSIYREFFTHELNIGTRKHAPFLRAFADVYAKYALIAEENEDKLLYAAEDVYRALEDADAMEYAEEREALAAVIYREARIPQGERSVEKVAELFGANEGVVKEILNYII